MTTTPIDNTSITTGFNVDELTEGTLTGKGVFDVLLQTLRLHLDREFNSNRITGTAYATVYSQAITAFLAQAAQYAINKAKLPLELQLLQEQINLTHKQQEQVEAETSRVMYEIDYKLPEEILLIKHNQDQTVAQTNKVANDTVVTVKQGNLVDAQIGEVNANVNKINAEVATKLPEEVEILKRTQTQLTAQTSEVNYRVGTLLPSQTAQVTAETAQISYKTNIVMPEEVEILKRNQIQLTAQTGEINYRVSTLLPSQTAQNTAQTAQLTYTTSYVLPSQVSINEAQTALYAQKTVTETAQAVSTPASGSVMGVQNGLMATQKASYLRDAEQKAAKMLIDTWNVRFNSKPDDTDITASNRLQDADIGSAVGKMLTGIGV